MTKSATSISWIASAADVFTLTLTPPTGADVVTLPATDFDWSTSIKYTNGTDAAVLTESASSAAGAGSWDLNGASITALGISNSASVTPMIWIQNSGTSNGAISGSVNCNGSTITIQILEQHLPSPILRLAKLSKQQLMRRVLAQQATRVTMRL